MNIRKSFNFKLIPLLILLLWGFILSFSMHLQGVTFTVNTTADTVDANPGDGTAADADGNCSLRAAIMEANALVGPDTIEIPAGTYKLTIVGAEENRCATGDLDIRSHLTIKGAGMNDTIIDGNQLDRVFHVKDAWDVSFSNLTITKGKTPDGKNIIVPSAKLKTPNPGRIKSAPTVYRSTAHPQTDDRLAAAADRPNQTTLSLKKNLRKKTRFSLLSGSKGLQRRNLYKRVSRTDFNASYPHTDSGDNGGGILNENGTLTIESCKIVKNSTGIGGYTTEHGGGLGGCGGGIYNDEGTLNMYYSEVSENSTGKGGSYDGDGGSGGGIFNIGGDLTLKQCIIQKNTCGDKGGEEFGSGGYGGGIYSGGYGGSLTLNYCKILENNCGEGAGYEDMFGNFYGGGGGSGGGILSYRTLTVSYCTIRYNRAGDGLYDGYGGCGGGICALSYNSTSKIYNSLIADNTTGIDSWYDGAFGGGIENAYGTMAIFNSTISRNSTSQTYSSSGGGIANWGTLILESCTVTLNKSDYKGGGICNGSPDYPDDDTVIKIHNTTIANNTSEGWYSWHPTGPDDCAGIITSHGYNLIETTTGCTIKGDETGNIYGEDPNLGPLKDNGGPTFTHELKKGSSAIDRGDAEDFEETDQRGVYRPKDGNNDGTPLPDMGAFEKFTPYVTIISPTAGAKVCGTIEIEVEANTKYVYFYIDNKLLHTDDSEPFTCTWDTLAYDNGSHTIKAKGCESSDDFSAWDTVKVNVDNTIINLHASRQDESSWLIKRQYGKITFTVKHTSTANPAKYVIERKEANGSFNSIIEVPPSEVQGGSYTYNDCYLSKDITYTYRITAVDEKGMNVGVSKDKTI